MPSQVDTVCKCGRTYVHCPRCGRRNPYFKKFESANASVVERREIKVYRCSCGLEFTNENICTLQPKKKTGEPDEQEYKLGSEEHARLLFDWVSEKQKKHGWDSIKVYIEAQKAGWHLEAFGDRLDEDVKKALEERGLLGAGDAVIETTQSGGVGAQSPAESRPAQASSNESVPLEDIIKALQENQE